VGREVGCAFRFNDPAVSRRHLRFVRPGSGHDDVFVEDLASSNGTLLNGRAVSSRTQICDGDVISVGSRMLTVRLVDDDDLLPSTLILREPLDLEVAEAEFGRARTRQIPHVTMPPDTFSGDDRRRHDRRPMELRLIYVSSELEIEALTRDLSHSGVFVCTQILDPVGTACQLTILIDGGPPLDVRGVVRRVVATSSRGEAIGLGVELVGLGRGDRAWIDAVLARTI
jgi:hypothetical protein